MGADSPVLCLKLFDDRFLHMDDPRDDGYSDEEPPGESELEQWWNRYENEENGVRCEDMTYERLRFMQGSLLPWYYGAHRLTLPGGHTIYGILMEYVGGVPLGEGHAAHLPPQQQVELINSLRLGVRGMEHADVSQHDWHRKQILVSARSTSDSMLGPSVHCVLVDFSSCSTSLHASDFHRDDDFGTCLSYLVSPDAHLDAEIVLEHWGERQIWDTISATVNVHGELRGVRKPEDPYSPSIG
ncbi:hypothetical protein GLOTRDRAFT_140217 [Gloeophyllum trabeum ATCC 11539]|uniref:Protein kinase domain-containing protein n=1 Tax=Gloeophyllum trabeum (strain ATCC 11539 / FP-39264 / Madison 617) TaxID=670483 RepID=S7PYF7_GLOTA|nr:uncharacterized protein GLOTRDRAFT_140217 [Gloeophyllum trabeum ATCC 11539]EPQ52483.1 hypothetical protein GLOTRDRAFT_140217 [Gloeophyllum trabeum ATCC 11539]